MTGLVTRSKIYGNSVLQAANTNHEDKKPKYKFSLDDTEALQVAVAARNLLSSSRSPITRGKRKKRKKRQEASIEVDGIGSS